MLLGRHLMSLEVPVGALGHLGAIWGSSEEVLSDPGRHLSDILRIPWEIQQLNVPMMWSSGGPRNANERFCFGVIVGAHMQYYAGNTAIQCSDDVFLRRPQERK